MPFGCFLSLLRFFKNPRLLVGLLLSPVCEPMPKDVAASTSDPERSMADVVDLVFCSAPRMVLRKMNTEDSVGSGSSWPR